MTVYEVLRYLCETHSDVNSLLVDEARDLAAHIVTG